MFPLKFWSEKTSAVYTREVFTCNTCHVLYRWKGNFMLINICRRNILWKPMISELQPFKCYLMMSYFSWQIREISDALLADWKDDLSLINFSLRSTPLRGFFPRNLKGLFQNPRKGGKNVFTPAKISEVREIVQN